MAQSDYWSRQPGSVSMRCRSEPVFPWHSLRNRRESELFMHEILLAASVLASGLSDQPATNAPFTIQHHVGVDWLVKPNGEKFFSFGMCVVDQGASRADYNPTNPGFAAFRHYPNSNQWA